MRVAKNNGLNFIFSFWALRAVKVRTNCDFHIIGHNNRFIELYLSFMSMLERLALKDLIQRTRQRVKRSSAARVMA